MHAIPFVGCALLLAACGSGTGGTRTIAPGTVVEDDGSVAWDVDTRERLDVRMPGPVTGMARPGADAGAGAAPVASALGYTLPEGWTELPPRQFRDANFQAGDPQVECYVTLLAGEGGGMLANLNRWRGQLGLEPWDASALGALETVPMLGGEATLVELAAPEQALTGTVRMLPGRAVFVKMTGPPDLVAGERERFLALCGSLSLEGA